MQILSNNLEEMLNNDIELNDDNYQQFLRRHPSICQRYSAVLDWIDHINSFRERGNRVD